MIFYIVFKLAFVLRYIFENVDWSIFWSAFSAIGTVSAVVVAYWQIKKQTDDRNSDIEKEQASQISGWITEEVPAIKDLPKLSNTVYATSNFRNNSDLPIYNVYLLSSHIKSSESPKDIRISHYVHFDIIPPGDKKVVIGTMGSAMGGDYPALGLLFMDFRGVLWLRTTKGKLLKMENDKFNEFIQNTKLGAGPFNDGQICSLD